MIQFLPWVIYSADARTRRDFAHSQVVNERDYVSTWLTRIRDLWALHGGHALLASCTTQVEETTFGVDAIIAVRVGDSIKAVAFEAKNPRFTSYPHGATKVDAPSGRHASRFDRQLSSQLSLPPWVVQTAYFIDDQPPGQRKDFDELGGLFFPSAYLRRYSVGRRKAARQTRGHKKSALVWTIGDFYRAVKALSPVARNSFQLFEEFVLCSLTDPVDLGPSYLEVLESLAPRILVVLEAESWMEDAELKKDYEASRLKRGLSAPRARARPRRRL